MDKSYFETRKAEIQSKIDSYNKEMKELMPDNAKWVE